MKYAYCICKYIFLFLKESFQHSTLLIKKWTRKKFNNSKTRIHWRESVPTNLFFREKDSHEINVSFYKCSRLLISTRSMTYLRRCFIFFSPFSHRSARVEYVRCLLHARCAKISPADGEQLAPVYSSCIDNPRRLV